MFLARPDTLLILLATAAAASPTCKLTPLDASWPSLLEWASLNTSLSGTLIKTIPAASSCYPSNPFNSTESCSAISDNWDLATFHAALPEGIDYPIYANNSCLPPGAQGYVEDRGCAVGGSPVYVVDARSEEQVATAVKWAADRNIRVVVKGTGHDMNGRSSGAYSLSIWTRNFNSIQMNANWPVPGSNSTENVAIVGSGNIWYDVYSAAVAAGRVVVGGGAKDVGLGGYIQGGGHGPLSSQYGLAADQLLQATVVTTEGNILVANAVQNQDMLWALRGGGAGQYGIVIEYVLKTYPAPATIVSGNLELYTTGLDNENISAVWDAFAVLTRSIPDLMDAGLAGVLTASTGNVAVQSMASTAAISPEGVLVSHGVFGYNMTAAEMTALMEPVIASLQEVSNSTLNITWSEPITYSNFIAFFNSTNTSPSGAGQVSLMSSRLLGRNQLSNRSVADVSSYLQRIVPGSNKTAGSLLIVGMQAGPGPASVPEDMRGALNPVWRSTYIHAIALGAPMNATADPQEMLTGAGDWMNENKETTWREWAPDTGSYMNEGNCFNTDFKHDFYGTSYDRLLEIKKKYDPSESLFVLTGVGSDEWDYNLNSGKLCRST